VAQARPAPVPALRALDLLRARVFDLPVRPMYLRLRVDRKFQRMTSLTNEPRIGTL
jgi:hypothetical protein